MGCDGGTIPTRDELVRVKKKPEQKDKDSERAFRWKHCAISQERLQSPVVACELGSLYSKESVIELLLDRSKFPGSSRFDHIRGLKDVKSLELTVNPAYRDAEGDKGGVYIDRNTAQYICPITGLEMSGKYRFCYLYSCGCVFAERALKEVRTETCTKCGAAFTRDDVILLNGREEEVEELHQRMEDRRARAKLEKKSKKKRKAEAESVSESASGDSAEGASTSKQSRVEDPDKQVNGSAATKPKTSKDIPAGKGTSSNGLLAGKGAISKLSNGSTVGKSIQKDPKASEVYKSLFTSCDKAKNQPKGHWVTHNPQYY